jgi:hypothetical protein
VAELTSKSNSISWRWGVIAGIAMMLLALYPQFRLWAHRGAEWNGAYAYNDLDEVAYSAYLQALIDGRPRRNDPYTGRDLTGNAPVNESFFSIQFVTPMLIAWPSRVLGVSASTAMIVIAPLSALATTIALFFLLGLLTGDTRFAAVGAIAVLCLGSLVAGEGAIYELTGRSIAYPYLPFLRRYVPAVPFPFIFLFCAAVWRAATAEARRAQTIWITVAVGSFAFMVYSYFYLWTAAAAFLVCYGVWWAIARPHGRRSLGVLVAIAGGAVLVSLPYLWLLSRREPEVDELNLLVRSHWPDLVRPPEVIAFVILVVLGVFVRRGRLRWRDPIVAMTGALALTIFAVFNQQILTGRSLQPIHYQVFVGNYLVATAAVLCLWLIWRGVRTEPVRMNGRALLVIVCLAYGWGLVEVKYTTRILDAANIVRDQAVPVERQLAFEAARDPGARTRVVLPLNLIQGDDQPTFAPQPVLWSRHQFVFTGTSWTESKQRFFQLLYFSGVTPGGLDGELQRGNFVYIIALFGWGRVTDRLTADHVPLSDAEMDAEVQRYAEFSASFGPTHASSPELGYVVTHADAAVDFTHLDQWYERDAGQKYDTFVLYHLRLRTAP